MDQNQELVQKLLTRFESLKAIRRLNEDARWEAFAYMNHRTDTASLTNSPVPQVEIFSTAGQIAGENFINGFMGNLVSINSNWASFRYESDDMTEQDDIPEANKYLSAVNRRVMSELASSNFYAQDRLASKDAFYGACSATFITYDKKNKICGFDTLAPWDWWCDTDKNGVYDTFFYKKKMTAHKAYQLFGDKLPEEVIKTAKNGNDGFATYDYLLCIYPRNEVYLENARSIFPKRKKYAAVWICLNSIQEKNRIIDISGYDMFPVVIHCWEKDGDNPYGTSPVIRALPELRRLNILAYETALTIEKINHAPTIMTSAVQEQFSDDPGARIVVSDMTQAPKPLEISQTVDGAMALLNTQVEYIQRIFYNDMFNYLSRQDKVFTATQVNAVKSEELSLLSGIFGNIQTQKIEKIIRYVIFLLSENDRLPEGANKAFEKDGRLKIVLDSTLAQTLRTYTFRDANLATLEVVQQLVQMQLTEPLDNIDMNEWFREIMIGNGTDARVIVDKQEVIYKQQQRAMIQQQQYEMQMAQQKSEIDRNEAGASNLNNATGANQYK